MHRMVPFVSLALSVALVLCCSLGGAEESETTICFPVKTMYLQPPEGVEAKRPPAVFSHSDHAFNHPCSSCHHAWEVGEQIQNCTTSDCHDQTSLPEEMPKRSWKDLDYSGERIQYFKFAYHRLCIGCHRETKAKLKSARQSGEAPEGETVSAIPTGCVKCHER
jgi:hypothetical protein